MGYNMVVREQRMGMCSERKESIPLPALNKYVKVRPRDKDGNEIIEINCGRFMYVTKNLMFLKRDVSYNTSYFVAYLKTDLVNGIYRYEYL